MGLYSGDDQQSVQKNRQKVCEDWQLALEPQWLKQVHGIQVVRSRPDGVEREGDACFSTEEGVACVVQTADCLPVLFCNKAGTVVAAAHAGWKGLANGVLEATLVAMAVDPSDVLVWFGPAISVEAFEVGPEVREAFIRQMPTSEAAFTQGQGDRWMGNLYQLATLRLRSQGIESIYGGGLCTVNDPRFFSYRRDGQQSGRMASLIWIEK